MNDQNILSTLLPELQHDLIGRFTPGILLVLVVLWRFGFFSWAEIKSGLAALLVLLLVVAGFTVSLLLTPFSGLLNSWFKHRQWSKSVSHLKLMNILDHKFDLDLPRNSKNEIEIGALRSHQIAQLDHLTIDYLKEEDDYAGIVLPKMSAEVELCANLSVTFIFLAVLLGPWLSQGAIEPSWISSLVLLPVSLFAAWHRNRRLIARQHSYFDLVLAGSTPNQTHSAAGSQD